MVSVRAVCVALLLGAASMIPATVWGGDFEGVLKWQTIVVPQDALGEIVGAGATKDADKIFAVPIDKVKAAKGAQVHESTIYVKGSKVRADISGPGPEKGGYVITDVDQGTSKMVMPKQKKYIEWTKVDMEKMGKRMEAMRKAMQERLANLPPEQRKQVEGMMKGMTGPSSETKPEVKALGKTETINGMQTTGYEVKTADETAVGWVTKDHQDLMQTFAKMQKSQERMLPPNHRGGKNVRAVLAEQGLPVRVQVLDPMQYHIDELREIKQESVAADQFEVPAGYKKSTMQQMMHEPRPKGPHAPPPK